MFGKICGDCKYGHYNRRGVINIFTQDKIRSKNKNLTSETNKSTNKIKQKIKFSLK